MPALDDKMTCELLLARGEGQRRGGKEQEARRSFAAAVRLASTTGSPTNSPPARWDWPDRPRTPCSASRSTSR